MPKRKSFVDKKNSVAFRLVHRSQKDPLIATDDGELVLAPIEGVEKLKITESTVNLNPKDRALELVKFGVYFDDDYDYLQHLRDVNEVYSLEPVNERYRILADGSAVESGQELAPTTSKKIQLPSSLFESKGVELKIGLLNQAAPQPGPHPELDPDIVAALDDDDFDFTDPNNQLEDDFFVKANAPVIVPEHRTINEESESEDSSTGSDDSVHGYGSDQDDDEFEGVETKSRFTNYSLSSSVMHRSQGLQQVDAMFEKLYEQYDEEEMGDLDTAEEQITGFLDPDGQRMRQLVEEYEEDKEMKQKISDIVLNEKDPDVQTRQTIVEEENEEMEKIYMDDQPRERWDCESVLSTYSNLYNHPTLIVEPKNERKKIRLDPKTGLPRGVLKSSTLAPMLKQLDSQDAMSVDTSRSKASTVRSKLETPEQKRLRKQMIKTERKERRVEKKSNQLAFKSEEKRRNICQLNLQQNLLGVKLL